MALHIYNEFGEEIRADTIVSSKLDTISQQLRGLVSGVGALALKTREILSAIRAVTHR